MSDDPVRAERLMQLPAGERCRSCALRPGTRASQTLETLATLKECIQTGEPFYCHESVAVPDPNGLSIDEATGIRYRWLPESQWRVCRGWTKAMFSPRSEP